MTDEIRPQPDAPVPPPPPPKRHARWKKVLAWTGGVAGGLIALILLFGPMVIASVARGRIASALAERIDGRTELGGVSFSWTGAVRIDGLAVQDRQARPVFSAKQIAVDLSLFSALAGSYVLDVRIDEPALTVARDPDGTFNVATLLKPAPLRPPKPPRERAEEKLPFVQANLSITRGRLTFVDADERAEFGVTASARLDTFDKPLAFEAELSGSAIRVRGELTLAREGRLDLEHLHGPVRYEIEDLKLEKLQPLVATRLAGTLRGSGEYRFTSMTSVRGRGELTLDDLVVDTAGFKRVRLTDEIEMDAAGTGTQKLRLETGDYLVATLDARTTRLVEADGQFAGRLAVDAKLKGLTEAAGALMKMKPGTALGGTAGVVADLEGTRGGKLAGVVDAKLDDLSATDADGKPLPLDRSATLAFKGEYDPAGLATIERCELKTGSVTLDARGGADLARRTIGDSFLRIDADLDDVSRKVTSFMDLGFSFGGRVRVDSKIEGGGEVARLSSTATVSQFRLLGFRGRDVGPLDITLVESGTIDPRAGGRSVLDRIELRSDLLDMDATAEATDFADLERVAGSAKFTATARPPAIQAKLGGLFEPYGVAGADLAAAGEATFRGREAGVRGRLKTPELKLVGPNPVTLRDLTVAFAVADSAADASLTCRAVETGRVTLANVVAKHSTTTGRLELTGDFDTKDARGRLDASFDVKGGKVAGGATVTDLELVTPKGAVAEPKVTLTLDADVRAETMDVAIREARLDSSFAAGTLTGEILNLRTEPQFRALKGDFSYVPDKLGALLKPWLDGQFAGAERQTVAFTLDGKAREADWFAILRGCSGTATLGLGRYVTKSLDVKGPTALTLKDGRAKTESRLDMNRGSAVIVADIDLRDAKDARSVARFELRDVETNAGMSAALSCVHPIFAIAEGTVDALIAGRMDARMDLTYSAPLAKEHLTGGWNALPKKPLDGRGHFEVRDLAVRGAPLTGGLLSALEVDAVRELTLAPIDFALVEGRVRYDKPVLLRISGHPTWWTGTIGLDATLDLVWTIPVTDRLLAKHPFLKYWESIRIPVRGTATRPKIEFAEAIAELAKEAAKRALSEKAGEGLEDLLGGKAEKEAKKLLEDADKLFAEGRKKEAAALYTKLHDEYRKTRAYKDNKERVKERMTE